MNHEEALTVTQMVVTSWPSTKVWTAEEMTAYANGLQRYDAEACTRAVAAAQQKLMYRPSVAELREFYDIERAKLRTQMAGEERNRPLVGPTVGRSTLPPRHVRERPGSAQVPATGRLGQPRPRADAGGRVA